MSYDLLEGVRVVELSMYAFAPSTAAVLAEWGADVVKVVPPKTADPMMGNPIAGLPDNGMSASPSCGRCSTAGKRCIGVDVSTEDGRQVLLDLVAQADVFVTNLLPGRARPVPDRSGGPGRGQPGPGLRPRDRAWRGGPGARGRWLRPHRLLGPHRHRARGRAWCSDEFVPQPGPAMGDLSAGAFLAGSIAAALYRRMRDRARRRRRRVAAVAGMWVGAPAVVASQLYQVDTIPRMRHDELPNPLVAAYTTRDGRQIYLAGHHRPEGHFDELLRDASAARI